VTAIRRALEFAAAKDPLALAAAVHAMGLALDVLLSEGDVVRAGEDQPGA